MKPRAAIAFALILAYAVPARADEARTYFDIGAKAYEAGHYVDAVRAFQEAYRLSKRPGLLFSLGQANRMEFFARNDLVRLKDAVHYYRLYLQKAPSGDRVADATAALATLKPILLRLGGDSGASASALGAAPGPRVMISSPTEGVQVTFDGKSVSNPYIAEVAPGKHHIALSAPGFRPYQRDIVVDPKTGVSPIDVALKEKAARLSVRAPGGAEVMIDGRLQGETPLPPLALSSGRHFIAVTLNGHEAFSRTITLGRGESKAVSADLPATTQRTLSWVMMGVGVGGMAAGGVLAYLAIKKQSDAQNIQNASASQGNLPSSDLARYNAFRQSRDDYRLASVATLSAGVGVAAVGLLLHAFDAPKVPMPPAEQTTPGVEKRAPEPGFEVSAAPIWSREAVGASVAGSF